MRPALRVLPIILALAMTSLSATAAVSIEKVNGSIHAEAGQVYGQLETVNGSIRIDDDVRTAAAETVNGSIHVGSGARTAGLETVNGSIRVGPRSRVDGGIVTVNGSVFLDRGSAVDRGVETVNGAIGLVDSDVAGGIETFNGDITVGVGSHVRGGILVDKSRMQLISVKKRNPRVVIGPGAQVDGRLVFKRPVTLYVHESARTGAVVGASAIRFNGATPPAR